jgi:SAM-dependent methyltransferase
MLQKAKLRKHKDAFGQAVYDHFKNARGHAIIERDDGYFECDLFVNSYFADYKKRLAKGKVLDIGCGAGRVALYLQEKGLDVLGVDNSPLMVKVCKERGVKKVKLTSMTQLNRRIGIFDTIVMYGNNFGLFGNRKRAKWLLKRFYNMTTDKACIIAQSVDPYDTKDRNHLEYHRFNRARGRMTGQIRLRVRYKKYVSDWSDFLLVSKDEMHEILDGTGWKASSFIDPEGPLPLYIAIIEKE